jgi:hypothetical protein
MKSFKSREWQYAYKTSAPGPDNRAVDILHDFYIPALSLSVNYDRVAGYFRSSSLAAASQGFSAFTASAGRMRLITGADLAEEDVQAILAGNEDLMARRLDQALGPEEIWPEAVVRGVELLSWMVAQEHLEVRVAFRVHGKTGAPMIYGDTRDGYVHEKWAVFTDEEGDRLYIAGSLNESRTALELNAENIDVHGDWWNDLERRRTDDADHAFGSLWQDENPHLRVLPLPEAVRQRLIRIGERSQIPREIDGTTAVRPRVDPPSAIERLRAALIKDGPHLPQGRFVGMETAPVRPWPHQAVVARRLVETWPYSYLLCDEVGLGKTIEAGLAIRSLYLAGLVKRVLIAPPASLTRQWHREMASKFFLPFARLSSGTPVKYETLFPFEKTESAQGLYEPELSIVSTGLVSRKERLTELQKGAPFDIALIDEAHYARRKNPANGTRAWPRFGNLYTAIEDHLRPRTRCLWMATATPMQLDWVEVFDLIRLIGRVGPFQLDPSLTWAYYRTLTGLMGEHRIPGEEWEMLRRSILSLERHDPFLWRYLNEAVIYGIVKPAARQWLEQGRAPVGTDRNHIRRLIFSAAPLSRVMLRHTRPLLELYQEKGLLSDTLARREIVRMPTIVMTPLEKKAYDELEAYCVDLSAKIASCADGKKAPTSLGFLLSFLRLRFASSLFAIRETLRRRRERVIATLEHHQVCDGKERDLQEPDFVEEDGYEADEQILESLLKNRTPEDLVWERKRLEAMLLTLNDLRGMPSKMKELLSVLNTRRLPGGRIEQTVVFTRFYDTLHDLVERLRNIDPSLLIGTYSGRGGQFVDPRTQRLRGVERDEIKHRFLREEIDILICTDAAAEGLNLQTADLLINYDLPWNPMKVEQRIGRIDRIGQKHDQIYVLNLCYVDSAEQIVYDRLLQRLAQTGDIVGLQQVSLLPIKEEEFNDLAAGVLRPEELENRARERIALQKSRTQSMEIPARDLYAIYQRMSDTDREAASPVTLKSIWEFISNTPYLKDLGGVVSAGNGPPWFKVQGVAGIPDGTTLTVDRGLYDRGGETLEGRLHFASYGDPAFEALMAEFDQYDLPPCVARLTEDVTDLGIEVVAYAAAGMGQEGLPEVRLITSWKDLDGLRLDESFQLSEAELAPVRKRLHDLARETFDPTRAVATLERQNERAGRVQNIMNLLIARKLLPPPGTTDADNFWVTLKERLDPLLAERERLLVPDMPLHILADLCGELPYDLDLPRVGEKAVVTLPIYAVAAALDAGCRIADSMRRKKADLTIAMVHGRLDKEIEKEMRVFRRRR